MSGHINIALLDRAEVQSQLKKHYKAIFESLNYKCKFHFFTEQNEVLEHFNNFLVHIFICDLSLGDTDNFQGLNLIQEVKINWPQILCIGNTKRSVSYRQTVTKHPTFDIFVDKAKLLSVDKRYLSTLAETIAERFKMNVFIGCSPKSEFIRLVRSYNDLQLQYLLGQTTFTGHPNLDMVRIDEVLLKPMSGGRSGSDVYKVSAYSTDSSAQTVPAVLKISTRKKAEIELDNYHRYVKWTLPYTWRVDILGTGFSMDLGAICYSFILSGKHAFDSFTYYIEKNNDAIIDSVIEQVFSPNLKAWYSLEKEENDINSRYSERYFSSGSMNTEENNFLLQTQKLFQGVVQAGKVIIDDFEFPLPIDYLFGEPNGDYLSCICHGDLNSNNIIVAPNREFIFIDFQDTGRGHVFEDFITLEASIRLNYAHPVDLDPIQVLNDEISISTTKSVRIDAHSVYKHILKIRELAFKNFPSETPRNYYYGVAAFNFRLLRLPNLSDNQTKLVLSAILANLRKDSEI